MFKMGFMGRMGPIGWVGSMLTAIVVAGTGAQSFSAGAVDRHRTLVAHHSALGDRGANARKIRQTFVVVIDPRHPSERSSGSEIVNGISEVHACWLVAVRLKKLLQAAAIPAAVSQERERSLVS